MFCGKCGAETENETKFCKECGHELNSTVNQSVTENTSVELQEDTVDASSTVDNQSVDSGKRQSKKLLIGVIGVVVIALIIIICLSVNKKPTINLDKYVTIEVSGYEGYGEATAEIDWDALEKDSTKVAFGSKAKKTYGGFLKFMTPVDVLKDIIDIQFSDDKSLSNGDKIEYTWDIEDDLSLYLDCNIKSEGGIYVVTSLEEIETFDAFGDLEVYFEGTAPNGEINYEYLGEHLDNHDFSCSQFRNLKNGDKVIISIEEKDIEYYIEKSGMVPSEFEKEYVVSGLHEYVDSYSKLSSDFIETVKKEAEDTIYAYIAKEYSSASSLKGLQYVGYIYDFVKESGGFFFDYNNLHVIYSGMATNSEGRFDDMTVYFPVRFTDILRSNGNITYESNEGIVGMSEFSDWCYTEGYINPMTCYIEIVEGNSDSYSAEVGDGFEKYAEYEMITSLSDMSTKYKAALQSDALARVNKYIESSYDDKTVASDLQYLGEYLLVRKEQGTSLLENVKCIAVCSITLSHTDGAFDTTPVYFPIEYDGIVKLPGEEFACVNVEGILGYESLSNMWNSTYGYLRGTEMFSEIVTANRDKYKYEVSSGLIEFGE